MINSFYTSITVPARFVFLIWLSFFISLISDFPMFALGIRPRELTGLAGIVFSPLIHGDYYHLISNTFPLLFLGTLVFMFYGNLGNVIFFRSYFWTNVLVWVFARPSNHIGASGVVYGLAFFLMFYGMFNRNFVSLLISILVTFLYGSVFYGLFPNDPTISYESHFSGALVGVYTAIEFSKFRKK